MMHERFDRKLIKLVKENPVLYDFNDPKYVDLNSREVAWQKIGDELKRSAVDCKVRWINIRDVHRRILRKSLNGLANTPKKAYKYESELKFMRPFYKDIVDTYMEEEYVDEEEKNSDQWEDPIADNNADDDMQEAIFSEESEKPLKKIKTKRKYRKRKHIYKEEKPASISFNETPNSELDPTDSVDAFLLSIGATLKTFSPYHLNVAKTKIFTVVQEHDLRQIVEKDQHELSDVKVSASDAIYIQQCQE